MLRLFVFLLFVVMLTSCGKQVIVEHIGPPPLKSSSPEKVVILPFDNYALLDEEGKKTLQSWYRENMLVYSFLSEGWAQMGYFAVPFEEVFYEFKRRGWIKIEYPKKEKRKAKENSTGVWEILRGQFDLGEKETAPPKKQQFVKIRPYVVLSENELYELGREYGARYIVRGRIASVTYIRERSANPFKGGFLAGTLNFVTRGLYGKPSSPFYDKLHHISVAGAVGGVIGSNAKDPFEPPHEEVEEIGHPMMPLEVVKEVGGNEDYDIWNSLIFGSAGAAVGLLASEGGVVDRVKVEVSIYVYDVKKQQLVWYDNVKVDASPLTFLSSADSDSLLYEAMLGASKTLMSRLQQYFFYFPVPPESDNEKIAEK